MERPPTLLFFMTYTTSITDIKDGKEFIRGYNLEDLIAKKSFAEVIFLVLKGELPTEAEARMMNALCVAAIDHGPGTVSAQAARIVASAKNSMHASLAAGVLGFGEQHGSAVEGASKFFQEHKDTNDLPALLKELKEKKVRIAGFGHTTLDHDHRSDALFAVAKETGTYGAHCAFAEMVTKELNIISSKKLPLNVDGSMGAVISDMGFDWRIAKGFFIIARMPGLVAHVYEEMVSGDGIRRVDQNDIVYTGLAPRPL